MNYSKKAATLQPSITLSITAKAKALKKEGYDVIGFGAGEPDFNTPKNIIEACKKALDEGKTKYVPASGLPELKEAVVRKFKRDNNLNYGLDQVIISTGGKQCLNNAFMAMLNPGDEVLLAAPYWVSYPDLITLADGVSVMVKTEEENDFKLNRRALSKAITPKSKVLLINSPNNPTGSLYNQEELEDLALFAKEHDLFIISDEIYEHLIYEDENHVSIASLSKDAYERTLVINALSKSYAMTGWRIGYAAGPKDLIKIMGNIQSHTTSNSTTFVQYAAVEALDGDQSFIPDMIKTFKTRRNLMMESADQIAGLKYLYPHGAFYLFLDIRSLLGKNYKDKLVETSLDFAKILLDDYLVAVVPGIGFGVEGFLGLFDATSEENIIEGFSRIKKFVEQFS
ncbi:MAG: pyridoxal phosphate-dependent aminotransferase [Clostridium sp.]|nr:pyridoxal phosphate-dependent aminotransferase [Clostridium sp.]